jgi:hypothetical protein
MVPYNGIYGNQTVHRLYTNSTSMRIEMQFDYRNNLMTIYRKVA